MFLKPTILWGGGAVVSIGALEASDSSSNLGCPIYQFHGVMAIIPDFESGDSRSNRDGTIKFN